MTRHRTLIPLLRLALCGFVPLGLSGCGSALRSGAEIHQDAGRPERAVELLEQELARNPGDARTHLALARACADLDSVDRAAAEFARSVALDPTLRAEADRSRKAAANRFRERGTGFLAEARTISADSPQRSGRLTLAAAALRDARLLAPEAPEIEIDLYHLSVAQGDSVGAESHLVEATRLAGTLDDPELARELAPIYREKGQDAVRRKHYRLGITLLDAAAGLAPNDADVLTDLASAYLLEAEMSGVGAKKSAASYRDADQLLERVRVMRPDDPDVLYNLATIRLRSGRAASADSLMRAYLRLRIEDAEGWQLFEVVQREQKSAETARLAGLAGDLLGAGKPQSDPAGWARQAATRFGPASALGRWYAEHGAPERVDARRDRGGRSEELWIHIRERRVAAFKDGAPIGAPIEFER